MEMSLQKMTVFYRYVSGVAGKKELRYFCGKLINGLIRDTDTKVQDEKEKLAHLKSDKWDASLFHS